MLGVRTRSPLIIFYMTVLRESVDESQRFPGATK